MNLIEQLRTVPGKVGFYYHALDGEKLQFQAQEPMLAASVIKLPIMVTAFHEGIDFDEEVEVTQADKVPSCGALTYLHDGLKVTVRDLITLMIILSDNTATNMMIDRLGADKVNQTMVSLGIPGVHLRRKMFDSELARQGIENTVTAEGIGMILERMAQHELLGRRADEEMISILLNQRLNGKMPFYLHSMGVKVAHKTGEDTGITHDVGIVFAQSPFVLCMLSNQVDVPAFERLIQDTALELYRRNR